jgi:hypothetical protein
MRKWIEVFLVDRVVPPKTCGLRHHKTPEDPPPPTEQGPMELVPWFN